MPIKTETKRPENWLCSICGTRFALKESAEKCETRHHADTDQVIWAGECEEEGCFSTTSAELDKNGNTLALFCDECGWREEGDG